MSKNWPPRAACARFFTPDDDPAHIPHAVGVVLEPGAGLHCANPAPVVKAAAELVPDDREIG